MRIETQRLVLREWRDEDRGPLSLLTADEEAARFMPPAMTREESDAFLDRMAAHLAAHGFGPLAVVCDGELIGVAGLIRTSFEPWIEIAWRIAGARQNQGYATEAARAALADGFSRMGFDEIVAYAAPGNAPSRRVMEKLGMTFDREFDHPRLQPGHPLRRHVLYRIRR